MDILYDFNKMIGTLVESKKTPSDSEVKLFIKIDWLEQLMDKVLNEGMELKGGVLEQAKEIGLAPNQIQHDEATYEDYQFNSTFDHRALQLAINLLKFDLKDKQREAILSLANGHCINAVKDHFSSLEVHYAIGFYTDLIEFCSETIFDQYWNVLLSMCFATKRFPEIVDDDLHQTIFFSLGNLALRNEKLEKEKVDQIIFLMEDYSKKN